MDTRAVNWSWGGKAIRLNSTEGGSGRTILLLPALSSISTRHEMRPLQERLAHEYSTLSIDWPGFGDQAWREGSRHQWIGPICSFMSSDRRSAQSIPKDAS